MSKVFWLKQYDVSWNQQKARKKGLFLDQDLLLIKSLCVFCDNNVVDF